jgi:hypothetical protein
MIVALVSLIAAIVAGIVTAFSGTYLYDRGMSKGNDLAIALISFHAAATFVFVSLFTYLWSRRGGTAWRTPLACLAPCVFSLVVVTVLYSSAYDDYYATFFVAGWLAVAIAGLAALFLSKYILLDAARHSRSDSDSL